MGKLNYKNFNFNKKEDYLYGLYLVISAAYQGVSDFMSCHQIAHIS